MTSEKFLHLIIGLLIIGLMSVIVFFITKFLINIVIKILKSFRKDNSINPNNLQQMTNNQVQISQEQQESSVNKLVNLLLFLIKLPFLIIGKICKGIIYIIQRHCPKCDGTDIERLGSKEIDRWNSNKKVTETLASGKTKTRYVNITKIKVKHYYLCNTCGHEFTETEEREK